MPTETVLESNDIETVAAHTEEFLDRRAVEGGGCHSPQGGKDFVKSLKPGGLGGPGGRSYSTIR